MSVAFSAISEYILSIAFKNFLDLREVYNCLLFKGQWISLTVSLDDVLVRSLLND